MKPLLVSYSDIEGGAARAAYRLHHALLESGVDSSMRVRKKLSSAPAVHAGSRPLAGQLSQARRLIESRLVRLQRTGNVTMHSANVLPTRLAAELNSSGADIVNIHWIGAGTLSPADLARIRLPIVMTLHDMWAFCGAEHYAPDTEQARWRIGYPKGSRAVGDGGLDLDRWTWRRKESWEPMTIVCPSNWLAECARSSALMREWPIHAIPNPLDTALFQPVEQARAALDIPPEVQVIMFGALGGVADERKGFDLLVAALHQLDLTEPMMGLVAGQDAPVGETTLPIPIRWLGHLDSDEALAQAYSAADVVVVPSRQENLPQMATEAQACGTPVVGFATTGMPDAVVHRETGYLAEHLSPADLARGIAWTIGDEERRRRLGHAARSRATRLWAPEVVARSYLAVYSAATEPT